jgi:hypothetical protein
MELKAGTRIRSSVCATELMVIQCPDGVLDLCCGGAAMLPLGEEAGGGDVDAGHKEGTQIGKRYVNEAGDLELLCTKPGEGSLSAGDVKLALKEAKPLPSSD